MAKVNVYGLLQSIDGYQQRHRWLAFPVAVWKKTSDDEAGNLAALLAFYAFVSLFPLLMVMTTVLGVVLRRYPGVQQHILNSALVDFPVIGSELRTNIHTLGRGGLSLAIALLLVLFGSRGLANSAQSVFNRMWTVPYSRRSGFPFNWLRSYGMIAVLGFGALATTTLSSVGTWAGRGFFGLGARIAILAASFAVDVALFWLGMRLATAREVAGRDLRLGAALAALIWQVLQLVGGFIVERDLRHASSLYGVFGLVLGLIAWLYFQARLTIYAAEIDVVRTRKLWPRSLFPPLTPEDRRAYKAYQKVEERRPPEELAPGVSTPEVPTPEEPRTGASTTGGS